MPRGDPRGIYFLSMSFSAAYATMSVRIRLIAHAGYGRNRHCGFEASVIQCLQVACSRCDGDLAHITPASEDAPKDRHL
jgi:hypothetical protein